MNQNISPKKLILSNIITYGLFLVILWFLLVLPLTNYNNETTNNRTKESFLLYNKQIKKESKVERTVNPLYSNKLSSIII